MTSIPSFSSPSAYTTRPSVSDQQRTGVLTVNNSLLKTSKEMPLFGKAVAAIGEAIGGDNALDLLAFAKNSTTHTLNIFETGEGYYKMLGIRLGQLDHPASGTSSEIAKQAEASSYSFLGPISSDPLTSLETHKRVLTLLAHVKKHTNTESNELDIPSLFKPTDA